MKKLIIAIIVIAGIVFLGIYIGNEKKRVEEMNDRITRNTFGITQSEIEDLFRNHTSR